ncbi:CCA tRNA nucleotidyltransferase [Sphingomonas sp. BN140010]|uniref:CCA tRNA nucleotidyltransferase n=1 Tax=Sphingomonas arvum TaxID=2992113 RepID=A0ABT3JI19_9SPHN|nr:CCA tRNA nucleotidyltransferase [Sphingomonas sp. BN140010]MCW3798722.1 CCA tRNA nucleotidyltransferase [Sphingomonas sp. BN140010]
MELSALDELAARPGIAELLRALGTGTSRFVGGAVRDRLLGLDVQDVDLATTLTPYEVMRRCGAADIKTVPTGIEHGTVTAVIHRQPVEITTLRADVSTDGRRATVAFTDDWQSDAERRDFTINALYWDPAERRLIDYFDGQRDLTDGRVRFIGEPLRRIAEDHLRILRFFRFQARFGGVEPDSRSLAACIARANDLMALSRERIADELLKLLAIPDPAATVELMVRHSILRPVVPEIAADRCDRLAALIRAETVAGISPDALRRLAALLPSDPVVAERVAARLKLSNKARKRLAVASTPELNGSAQALAYWIGREGAEDRLLLSGQAEDAAALSHFVPHKLPVGGGDLIRRGLVPGPAVARTLQTIERRWVAEGFPGKERLAQLVGEALEAAAEQG